jgi:hypothetical protein
VRAFTLGPTTVAGTLQLPLSASEIIELLLMGVAGAETGVLQTAAYLWTFTPGTALDPATLEWDDGARAWEAGGCYVNKLKFSGNVKDANTVEAEVFGLNMELAALTGSLAERQPDFIEGWETKLFVDALGDTPGTTQVLGTLLNWEVEFDNQLGRKYFAENSINAGAVTIGEIMLKAKLTFEAAPAIAATEFANWDAATERLVRLDFGNNAVIAGAEKTFVTVDVPGAWESVDLGGTDEGTRVYELSLQYMYDLTNAFGLQVRAQNDRSAAW